MEPIGTFQGLASGIDFRDLVDQIIAAESQPLTTLQGRIDKIDLKTTAWDDFKTRVQTVYDRASEISDGTLFRTWTTGVGASGTAPVSVTASSSASPGSFAVTVTQLATHEKVAGDTVADQTEALGFTGEFLVGGRGVSVSATDSLQDIALSINQANSGSSASNVSASVVAASGSGYRLVLTAEDTGAAGIALADGSDGVLRSLGFLDTTVSIKHQTSAGAKSDEFTSGATAVATLRGLSTPPAAAAVDIGGVSVTIDLSVDSLEDIATAINTAAGAASSAVAAQVVVEENADGDSVRRLEISNTTSFTDSGGILETLGVLEAGRSAVAQEIGAVAFTDGDAVTPATGSTLLSDLWGGGSAAGITVGDTLTFNGTQGDGTTFTKTFTVGAGDTYQDLVDSLNSASDGFGSGSRPATASIAADGTLGITDGTAGGSRLSLGIIAHNEGGGTLDFGEFAVSTAGRDRQLADGQDAGFDVDGVYFTRTSNTVTDVVEGVTLTLVSPTAEQAIVSVERDVDAVVSGIDAFIKAYNTVAEFVDSQFTGAGAEEGAQNRPLSGDGIVRTMRAQLRNALQQTIASAVTDVRVLSDLGITLNREGTYDVDLTELNAAIENDALSVQRFFSVDGSGSTGTLDYLGASEKTTSGEYDVQVVTAAAQATVTGVGFAGTYVDDGVADTLTLTDTGTGSVYEVALSNGMGLSEIVDGINTELQTDTQHQIQSTEALSSDAVGTAATTDTLLQDLYDSGGSNYGIADGDLLSFSGTRDDGSSFFREWAVTDVTTQTLGDLRAEIVDLVGTDVDLDLTAGVFTATAVDTGRSSLSISVSSDNAGGGTFTLGSFDTLEVGRGKATLTASDVGGQLSLLHERYGATEGFEVAFTAGGTDGSASLGVGAASYVGVDVVGTIGGQSATGSGQILAADEGTSAEGLLMRYTGDALGTVGSMTFSRGIASLMELAADALLDVDQGSVKGVVDALDTQKQGIEGRMEEFELRLDRRHEFLIRKFTALEEAMARAQNEMAWMQSALGGLVAPATSSEG